MGMVGSELAFVERLRRSHSVPHTAPPPDGWRAAWYPASCRPESAPIGGSLDRRLSRRPANSGPAVRDDPATPGAHQARNRSSSCCAPPVRSRTGFPQAIQSSQISQGIAFKVRRPCDVISTPPPAVQLALLDRYYTANVVWFNVGYKFSAE